MLKITYSILSLPLCFARCVPVATMSSQPPDLPQSRCSVYLVMQSTEVARCASTPSSLGPLAPGIPPGRALTRGPCTACQATPGMQMGDFPPHKAELLPAPEIREFSRIRSFSGNSTENSTENSVLFQNWSKTPQKASKWYRNVEKAPEIAQNFYIFVKSTQKSSRKAPEFFLNTTELFRFCQKYPKKHPNSGEISIW